MEVSVQFLCNIEFKFPSEVKAAAAEALTRAFIKALILPIFSALNIVHVPLLNAPLSRDSHSLSGSDWAGSEVPSV